MKLLKLLLILASAGAMCHAQQHGHLNVGAAGKNPGDPLNFNNGADFIASSGYVKTMLFADTGKYSNYFNGNISVTVMHTVDGLGQDVPGAPAPGSLIELEILSVAGPEGGKFGFWDDTVSMEAPAFEVPAGTLAGTNRYMLSNVELGAGQPGADPFGHIHGRRFTVNKSGLYKVGLRARDISTNGPAGGPIHPPSEILEIVFQGGYNLARLERTSTNALITVATTTNFVFSLQASGDLSKADGWTNVATINGTDYFETFTDEEVTAARRFYRMRVEPVVP